MNLEVVISVTVMVLMGELVLILGILILDSILAAPTTGEGDEI